MTAAFSYSSSYPNSSTSLKQELFPSRTSLHGSLSVYGSLAYLPLPSCSFIIVDVLLLVFGAEVFFFLYLSLGLGLMVGFVERKWMYYRISDVSQVWKGYKGFKLRGIGLQGQDGRMEVERGCQWQSFMIDEDERFRDKCHSIEQ